MQKKEIETFYAATKADWRKWLLDNHQVKQSVWLIQYKKKTGMPTVSWSEAVEEALCFGWIDSIKKTLDEERLIQCFSKRKPKGTWSKINKDKILLLIENGHMAKAGLDAIEAAKLNGSWTMIDEVETLLIPADLQSALANKPEAETFFLSLSKSSRKAILQWLVFAKRAETRQKRIEEIATLAAQKLKPKGF